MPPTASSRMGCLDGLAGNLQGELCRHLEVFIQTGPGGQNTLTNINPNIDGNGLNRMGAGGNGAQGAVRAHF